MAAKQTTNRQRQSVDLRCHDEPAWSRQPNRCCSPAWLIATATLLVASNLACGSSSGQAKNAMAYPASYQTHFPHHLSGQRAHLSAGQLATGPIAEEASSLAPSHDGGQANRNSMSVKKQLAGSPVVSLVRGKVRLELPLTFAGEFKTNSGAARTASHDEQSMDTRHRYAFTVNGRELALEPPGPSNSSTGDSHKAGLQANKTSAMARKVSHRLGDFSLSSSSSSPYQDYDSGFDVTPTESSLQSQQVAESNDVGAENSSPSSRSGAKVAAAKQSMTRRPADSSSSSLMSPTVGGRTATTTSTAFHGYHSDRSNADSSSSSSSSSPAADNDESFSPVNLGTQQRQPSATPGEPNNENQNKIISDWPRRATAGARLATEAQQQVATASNGHQNQAASNVNNVGAKISPSNGRFSTLLSTNNDNNNNQQVASKTSTATNEPSQPGERHRLYHWNVRELANGSLALKAAKPSDQQATDRGAGVKATDDERRQSTGGVNIKLSVYPRAPVYAKARYTSSIVGSLSSELANSNKSTSDVQPGLPSKQSTDATSRRSARASSSSNKGKLDHEPSRIVQEAEDERKQVSSELSSNYNKHNVELIEPNSIKEYPTNFTHAQLLDSQTVGPPSAPPQQQQQQNSRQSPSRLIRPLKSVNNAEQATKSTKAIGKEVTGQPKVASSTSAADQSSSSRRLAQRDLAMHRLPLQPVAFNLNAHYQPVSPLTRLHQMASRQLDDLANQTTNSIVRSGSIIPYPFAAPQAAPLAPAGAHQANPLQLRALVPAAMALLAQAHQNMAENKHSRASSQHLRALLAANQLHLQNLLPVGSTTTATTSNNNNNDNVKNQPISQTSGQEASLAATGGQQNLSDQMVATSNQLGVAHLGPTSSGLGASESSSYNSIVNMPEYPDYRPVMPNSQVLLDAPQSSNQGDSGQNQPSPASSSSSSSSQPSTQANNNNNANDLADQNQRLINFNSNNDYNQGQESSYYDTRSQPNGGAGAGLGSSPSPQSSQQVPGGQSGMSNANLMNQFDQMTHNSRSSGEMNVNSAREGAGQLRAGSMDPYEELASGISTSEYERDLADLDEEFNRHASFSGPRRPLVGDSLLTLPPDRYEAPSMTRYSRQRPINYANDYSSSAGDYLTTAGSMSSIIPRPRSPSHWGSSSLSPTSSSSSSASLGATDGSDLWLDTALDYSPLASFLSPTSQSYSYRWRPRYLSGHSGGQHSNHARFATYPATSYLAAAASGEQPAYNLLPAYGATSAAGMPTETISFTLSPLAAAAAAAATALAAADKSRHHHHHNQHAWTFTLPRLASTIAAAAPTASAGTGTSTAASNPHATTAAALPTAYAFHRPAAASPYLFGSMPIYAALAPAPRPASAGQLTGAASGATQSILPYFHAPGMSPAIIAYRPAGTTLLHSTPLLTAASFAYPLRLPLAAIPASTGAATSHHHHHHSRPMLSSASSLLVPSRSIAPSSVNNLRPFYSDLQFAETKPKSASGSGHGSSSESSSSSSSSSSKGKTNSLTAMAKNLTKKMFGSASQIRPQHVAPPASFDVVSSMQQTHP